MNTVDQIKLKSKIEKLDKIHQVKILDILIKNQIKYSENRNGIFLNMDSLNSKTIQEITENLEYFQKQEKTLTDIETIKKELNQDYFKNGNKEKTIYVSNELQ
tara:strand:- start:50 stop:358 length:309 start_codon:yes stop_codon:yes gene_type:complete